MEIGSPLAMLLRREVLQGIEAGTIDLVFRKWTRPTVKTGGSLRTPVGLLQIEKVEKVRRADITTIDANRAGLELHALLAFLDDKDTGEIYRVELGSIGPDPRVALRQDDDLSDQDIADLQMRLGRLDRAGKRGPWTKRFLQLLEENPHVRAQDLADQIGLEKTDFKNDVRKLKALGLTISHSPGYELSPRGRALLRAAGDG